MNGLYDTLYWLFIFGIVAGLINGFNLFQNKIPDAGYTISNSTVTELQSAGTSQTSNDFSVWQLIQIFMTAIGSGITALFLVGVVLFGLLMSAGAYYPFAFAVSGSVQLVVTYQTVWGLYELWTGRSVT